MSDTCTRCSQGIPSKYSPWCRACLTASQATRRARLKADRLCTDCAACPARDRHETCYGCADKRFVWQDRRDRNRKKRIVEHMGGKCKDCQLKTDAFEVYEMHHLDPSRKDFNVAHAGGTAWERVRVELEKCVMLCSNCHRIRHRKESEERLSRIPEYHLKELHPNGNATTQTQN